MKNFNVVKIARLVAAASFCYVGVVTALAGGVQFAKELKK